MPPLGRIRNVTKPPGTGRFTRVGELPATVRPTTPERVKDLRLPDDVISERRNIRFTDDKQARLEARAVPIERVYGSVQERIFYRELEKRKLFHGSHFLFQASMEGARPRGLTIGGRQLGGIVADFAFVDRPLVVFVQGSFWHIGRTAEIRDRLQVQRLAEKGWESRYLWDWELADPFLTEEWMRRNIDIRNLGSSPLQHRPLEGVGGWIG